MSDSRRKLKVDYYITKTITGEMVQKATLPKALKERFKPLHDKFNKYLEINYMFDEVMFAIEN
jgi:hypothetical protein